GGTIRTTARARVDAGTYVAVPTRRAFADNGLGGAVILHAGQSTDLQLTGAPGIPTTGVSAVAFALHAIGPTAPGYATIFPTGTPRPVSANAVFSQLFSTVTVITPVDANGGATLFL